MSKLVNIIIFQTRENLWSARLDFSEKHRVYLGPDTYSSLMYLVTKRIDHEIMASGSKVFA